MSRIAKTKKKILTANGQINKDVFEAFCEYVVGSNPNFAYSEVYLKKCIDDYIEFQRYLFDLLSFVDENILDVVSKADDGLINRIRLDEMIEYERKDKSFEVGLLDSFGIKKKTSEHKIELYYVGKRQYVEALMIKFDVENLDIEEIEQVRKKVENIICEVTSK